jgi:hypothetical protein
MPLRYNQLNSIPIMFLVFLLYGFQYTGHPSQDVENH